MAHADYIQHEKGLWSWLTTLDHKRIGLMYFVSIFIFFFLGGMAAILMRLELFAPGEANDFMRMFVSDSGGRGAIQDFYNQTMTFHGAVMVFMVIIPGIPAFLGNFFLPIMIGAKDVAFPRLNLLSYYVYLLGSAVAASSVLFGGADTGWTFYTPYSVGTSWGVINMVLGAFILGFSSILTGLNFVATVHKLRAPGMTMMKMPLFVWGLYSTAIIQVLATPVLAITLLLLIAEKTLGIGFFTPELGGDPVLFQHFFWFYSHPAVYIMVLPAMGVISELVTAFSKKTIFGYAAIAYSSIAIAAVSFVVWGHHMYVSGQSEFASLLFSLITMFVGVPTAIKLFNWVSTMYKGSIFLASPMLYAIGFMFIFTIGGVTGIFLATLAIDVHLHDTYFVVAHFHYVMVGGTLMALMGGIFYWFPKMFGKMHNEFTAKVSWFFIFVGFNVTFFPQFILGNLGMPRRYHDYVPELELLNQISTLGSLMIGFGFLVALWAIVEGILKGEKVGNDPWGGVRSLEWTIASPPQHDNFDTIPTITTGPYDYR